MRARVIVRSTHQPRVFEAVTADKQRRVRRHQYLIVACRQFAEHVRKMARLRRVLIQLGFFAAENQRWRIRRLRTGKLLKQRKEVGPLEAMPHPRETSKKIAISGLDTCNRLLKDDGLLRVRQPLHPEADIRVRPGFEARLKRQSEFRQAGLFALKKLALFGQRIRL